MRAAFPATAQQATLTTDNRKDHIDGVRCITLSTISLPIPSVTRLLAGGGDSKTGDSREAEGETPDSSSRRESSIRSTSLVDGIDIYIFF